MKIGIVHNETKYSGGAFVAENYLARILKKASADVGIEVLDIYPKHDGKRGLRTLYIFVFNKLFSGEFISFLFRRLGWRFPSRFERSLIKQKIDCVFFLGTYLEALILKKIPFVIVVWDLGHRDLVGSPETYQWGNFDFREDNLQLVCRKAFTIITDSKRMMSRLEQSYGVDKERTIPINLFPDDYDTILNLKIRKKEIQRERYLLYPANFWSHKNHITLLEALKFNKLNNIDSYKLIFTGSDKGRRRTLERLAHEFELLDRIEFHDFVSRDQLLNLYLDSEGLVYPSLLGPTNIPPMEALLLGIPLYVAEDSATNILRFKGVTSLDPFDVESWAKVLSLISENKAKTRIGSANRQALQSLHENNIVTLKEMLKKMESKLRLYRSCLDE